MYAAGSRSPAFTSARPAPREKTVSSDAAIRVRASSPKTTRSMTRRGAGASPGPPRRALRPPPGGAPAPSRPAALPRRAGPPGLPPGGGRIPRAGGRRPPPRAHSRPARATAPPRPRAARAGSPSPPERPAPARRRGGWGSSRREGHCRRGSGDGRSGRRGAAGSRGSRSMVATVDRGLRAGALWSMAIAGASPSMRVHRRSVHPAEEPPRVGGEGLSTKRRCPSLKMVSKARRALPRARHPGDHREPVPAACDTSTLAGCVGGRRAPRWAPAAGPGGDAAAPALPAARGAPAAAAPRPAPCRCAILVAVPPPPACPRRPASPPPSPPSGPRSTIQSALFTMSRLCSITSTVLPRSTSRCRAVEQLLDVHEVQAGGRLVEQVHGLAGGRRAAARWPA